MVEQDDPVERARGLHLAETNFRQSPQSHELGWAHYRNGHFDEAGQAFKTAAQRGRLLPDRAYFYARVLADQGQLDNARKLLETAAEQPGAFAHRDDAAAALESWTK
ncbi:MAG: hypothetical protein ACREHD_08610 [Pirellulales bacterium]